MAVSCYSPDALHLRHQRICGDEGQPLSHLTSLVCWPKSCTKTYHILCAREEITLHTSMWWWPSLHQNGKLQDRTRDTQHVVKLDRNWFV